MSGSVSRSDGYRCAACRGRKTRCEDCRAARGAKQRERRARKRAQGICVQCTEPADAGSLCSRHQLENLERSRASHALARAEGRE